MIGTTVTVNVRALDPAHHHHADPVLARDRAPQSASAAAHDHALDRSPAHAVAHPKSHDLEAAPDLDQLIISDADRALDHDLRLIRITTKKRKSFIYTDSTISQKPLFPNKLRQQQKTLNLTIHLYNEDIHQNTHLDFYTYARF